VAPIFRRKNKTKFTQPKKRNPTPMKTTRPRSQIALVIAALAFSSLSSARAAVETYDIDPLHTWVGFTIGHFFTKVPGYFSKVKRTIVVDREHLENSTVEAVIEVASITTTAKMRDDDLRSTNFFAAATFPDMTFKSKSWKNAGDGTYAVTGVLKMQERGEGGRPQGGISGLWSGHEGCRDLRLGGFGHPRPARFRHHS
jgi:hypothetical protein